MKASFKKNKNSFIIVMLIIAVVCCFITNASYNAGVSTMASSVLGIVVTPLQKLSSGVHGTISSIGEYFGDVKALKEENKRLQSQLWELEKLNAELLPLEKENDMLYRFLELKKERSDLKLVNATIISRSAANYTADFTIDKGSIHGIEKDMAVITDDGSLLGVIVEAGATFSRGKTLTSYDFSLGVKNQRTGEAGMLTSSFDISAEGHCLVGDLPDTTEYAVGDIVVTSSLGDIYPPGLYIGKVIELVPDKLGYTLGAVIEPSSTVQSTDAVMVIRDFNREYVYIPTSGISSEELMDMYEKHENNTEASPEATHSYTGNLPSVPNAITDLTTD